MQRDNITNVSVSENEYSETDGDLMLNQLIYEMPKALSLRTSKTHVSQYPQQSTYTVSRDTVMVWTWNTGNSYIDCANSYLKFRLKATGTAAVTPPTFGTSGSGALNLINSCRIRSKSGVELSRTENLNMYNTFRIASEKSQQWINTIGSAFYVNATTSPFNSANTLFTDVTIPLSEISSFFRPLKSGQLLPAQLASGLNIELSLESVSKSFKDPSAFFGAGSSLLLTDIHMSLSTVNLSDETSKILNLESSQSGLEFVYPRVFSYQNIFPAGSTNINIQLQKSVSQAVRVSTILSNNANATNGLVDSFVSESWKVKNWQYRLGSSYFPNQPVIESTTSSLPGVQSYMLGLASYDKMTSPFSESSVTLQKFGTSNGSISTSLERDSSLAISGQSINNSRVLEALIERDASADTTDKLQVDCFLTYIAVAKAYIDNVSVSI